MSIRSRTARICGIALTLVVLAGCGGAETPTGPPATGNAGFTGRVDIGDGRQLYLECRGTGSPTVVLIAGNGAAADGWKYSGGSLADAAHKPTPNDGAVFPTTSKFTRVCAYDRPGTEQLSGAPSRSSPVKQPTTVQGDAADLHALLIAAAVPGPYVLVGHSLGGFIATTYARTYPDVTGLVLIDPVSQYLETTLGPELYAQWGQALLAMRPNSEGEAPDIIAAADAINTLPPLPPMPVSVLSAQAWPFAFPSGPGQPVRDYWPQWFQAQDMLAAALNATHITQTNSGHAIFLENAPVVNQQICAVVRPANGC